MQRVGRSHLPRPENESVEDTPQDRSPADVERLLDAHREGDDAAFDSLVHLVYDELREIAHRHRARWSGDHTVGTTVLVHEAYLKLSGGNDSSWNQRSHFLAMASRAMRQVLIDYARSRKTAKRGGELQHISLDVAPDVAGALPQLSVNDSEALLSLDESLKRLAAESEQHCRIVEYRFFGDMTVEETAEALGVSPATVKRGWVRARAWIHRDMERATRD